MKCEITNQTKSKSYNPRHMFVYTYMLKEDS